MTELQPTPRRLLYALILAAGLVWIFLSADKTGASTAGRIPVPQKGFFAPDISLATPGGEKISLAQLRGKAVILNLWATWCPPCRAEMPAIEKYYELYRDQGLVVLGVNETAQEYNPLDIVPFVSEYGLTFPILLDETGEVARKYNLHYLPSSFFINRDATIEEVVVGPVSEALLQTYIEDILKSTDN